MTTEQNGSARIRDYAIAGFFVIGAILALIFVFGGFATLVFGTPSANIWSTCEGNSANVFIGANKELSNVKCVALDKEFFASSEVSLDTLAKNDEDVCRFMLLKNSTKPLRFEVHYNSEIKREVCDWQNYQEYVD